MNFFIDRSGGIENEADDIDQEIPEDLDDAQEILSLSLGVQTNAKLPRVVQSRVANPKQRRKETPTFRPRDTKLAPDTDEAEVGGSSADIELSGVYSAARVPTSTTDVIPPKPKRHEADGRDRIPKKFRVDDEIYRKYKLGETPQNDFKSFKTRFRVSNDERRIKESVYQAARLELRLPEQPGYVELHNEDDPMLDQDTIAENVDISSAQKKFDLSLTQFGPYRTSYTRNGRYLAISGSLGHLAAFDWTTKQLSFECNVMEAVNDLSWLHNETMIATAQKRWVYIYDRNGAELHCIRQMAAVRRLQFLPHHFLLVGIEARSYLKYLDVSVGQIVSAVSTKIQNCNVMAKNPGNAVICLGDHTGVVTMWAPSQKEPLVKMLCHNAGVVSMAIDATGNYMATSSHDRRLKIFDLRSYQPVYSYSLDNPARALDFSQRGLLAVAINDNINVYKDVQNTPISSPQLTHRIARSPISDLSFCPYEDVLGAGHKFGFQSLLVPGAGEPNYDAFEANPHANQKQRQEAEVRMLLDKIAPEMISLEKSAILKVDEDQLFERQDGAYKPDHSKVKLKTKTKGKRKALRVEQRKKGIIADSKFEAFKKKVRQRRREERKLEEQEAEDDSEIVPAIPDDPLSRFLT